MDVSAAEADWPIYAIGDIKTLNELMESTDHSSGIGHVLARAFFRAV
jgi:hypothetical protein